MSSEPHEPFPDLQEMGQEVEAIAEQAVLYRDLETANRTFALGEALKEMLGSIDEGRKPDYGRLQFLLDIVDAPPPKYTEITDEGTIITYMDGVEVSRKEPTPEKRASYQAIKAHKKAVEERVVAITESYVGAIDLDLSDSPTTEASLIIKVYRGDIEIEGIHRNTIELKVIERIKKHYKELGFQTREEHRRVKPATLSSTTSTEPEHTIHTVYVS